jgi:hypothetical protein
MKSYVPLAISVCIAWGCSDGERGPGLPQRDAAVPSPSGAGAPNLEQPLTREQLRDPESCKGCHPIHYREWASSMHAYSAIDPVFVAMNKRGQRETQGQLGDFCVKCHAPMAVFDKLTTDGLNLDRLPDKQRGVSCYFCHNVVKVEGDHDAMLQLANDTTMRAAITDPIDPRVHRAEASELFDSNGRGRNALCGSCHDIVTQTGVQLERTYKEYREGFFAMSASEDTPPFESCPGCHMPNRIELAAVLPEGVGPRMVHEHLWPGIDVALVDFPNREALRRAIEDCQLGIGSIGFFTLTVTPPNLFTFKVETNAGHNQPSGAAQDRRMWLELSAFDENGGLIAESSSGIIGDGELEENPARDPQLWMFRDRIYGADGRPVHMFWDAAPSREHPNGYESSTLAVRSTTLGVGDHSVEKQYRVPGRDGAGTPARITARLRIRPIGMDVLEDLVASGDLDATLVAQMPTFTFGAQLEWTQQDGFEKAISARPTSDCKSYRCLLEPGSTSCN